MESQLLWLCLEASLLMTSTPFSQQVSFYIFASLSRHVSNLSADCRPSSNLHLLAFVGALADAIWQFLRDCRKQDPLDKAACGSPPAWHWWAWQVVEWLEYDNLWAHKLKKLLLLVRKLLLTCRWVYADRPQWEALYREECKKGVRSHPLWQPWPPRCAPVAWQICTMPLEIRWSILNSFPERLPQGFSAEGRLSIIFLHLSATLHRTQAEEMSHVLQMTNAIRSTWNPSSCLLTRS